ncbi:cell wall assembly and cell proliferation coordinating protein, partial [Rhizodiscina lignyota]
LASSWRSFWHTMTSYDRHASHDSPYRTGQHVPLPQSRHAPLTSIATSALESRPDLSYAHDSIEDGSAFVNGANGRMSPQSPYKPGMRTSLQRVSTDNSASEIQMQNFSDGLPPAPPVNHSWKRIDHWAEDTYTELYDNLSEPCTQNDVNELEHELDCTLPLDVRESLQIHDGQERGGLPTGIIFGCMLLDCEEIVQEWQNWRKVGEEYLSPVSSARNSANSHANGVHGLSSPISTVTPTPPTKAFAGIGAASSSSSAPTIPLVSPTQSNNPQWRSDLLSRQTSHPPNSIQHAYTHPSWIPLARDWGGNCIAVDLAPGSAGRWGQIIVFGRDYDCKFVVARSWAHFLAAVADDFSAGDFKLEDGEPLEGRGNGGKVYVDEETGELRFREFWDRQPGVDVPYMEVLRWRCERKYGRRLQPRKGPPPVANGAPGKGGLRINPNVGAPPPRAFGSQHDSPYSSPTASVSSDQDFPQRGRSPSRFSQAQGKQPLVSSPLARVAEEPTTKIS